MPALTRAATARPRTSSASRRLSATTRRQLPDGSSTFPAISNLYDASTNGSKKGAAGVETVYARADSNYLYLIVEGPSALGGAGSMAGEPLDRSNLFIALDTPEDHQCDRYRRHRLSETTNVPASRHVNFKGWAPDYVSKWSGPAIIPLRTTSICTSGAAAPPGTSNGDFQTVLGQGTGSSDRRCSAVRPPGNW